MVEEEISHPNRFNCIYFSQSIPKSPYHYKSLSVSELKLEGSISPTLEAKVVKPS